MFTQEKVVKEPLANNDEDNGEEYGEAEDEEENESSQEEPKVNENEDNMEEEMNDEEYDKMLADAVREAIRQQQESPLKQNLNVSLKAVTFLEILCQNNPERPIVWEVIFSLLSVGANPLGNVQREKHEKYHANEAQLVGLLSQKCFGAVRKELLQELSVNQLFDQETNAFVAQEDTDMLIDLVQSNNNAEKAAAGVVLGYIIKNLGKQTDGVPQNLINIQLELQDQLVAKLTDVFCSKNVSLNRSFMQQLLSNDQIAEKVFMESIKKVKSGSDAHILLKLKELVPIMHFAQKSDQYRQSVFDLLIQQLNIVAADQSKSVFDMTRVLGDMAKIMKPTAKFIEDLKQVPARTELATVFGKIAKYLKGFKK